MCDDKDLKENIHLLFCDTRNCKTEDYVENESMIEGNSIKIFLKSIYNNIASIEPISISMPHNMIPFKYYAPEIEWDTYDDSAWVESSLVDTNTPWGDLSTSVLTIGDFRLKNFSNKSFYDIPILAFAYYDGPFALPETVRTYIIANEEFQRALLHPFEMIDTNTYVNTNGYKNEDLVTPFTLKYLLYTAQTYSGSPAIINQIILNTTFEDTITETETSFTSILLSWAEYFSLTSRDEDLQIDVSEAQIDANDRENNNTVIMSIPSRSSVEYLDSFAQLSSGELGIWKKIFNPYKASLSTITIKFYTFDRQPILIEPLLNGSIFSAEELPENYSVPTYPIWLEKTNNLSKTITFIFKIITIGKINSQQCILTREVGFREKHRKWNLNTIEDQI